MLNRQNDLRNNLQITVHEHVERVGDDALGGILDRHHAVIGAVFRDLGENVRDGFLRGITQAGTEPPDGRLVREGRLRPEIGDGHGFLERERAGHDLAVNGAERLAGDGALVQAADALKHGAFAVRRINFLTRLDFDGADFQHVLGAVVQQFDDLRVELVYRLAMLRNVHGKAEWFPKPARWRALNRPAAIATGPAARWRGRGRR